nr:xylulose kinase-1 [Tanacetum cinerariifolium]
MIAYLSKSDVSEGFNQIINFLNGCSIKYALTVNPNIYVSCIKQFWTTVAIKKVNDVNRLQALVDKKKVVVTEATIRDAFRLDDVEGVECLPNEEIFSELARMGNKLAISQLIPKYTSPALTQKVFANIRRVGKGFSRVETPLFEGMIVEQHVTEGDADEMHGDIVNAAERRNKVKVSKLRRLQKVGTAQRIDTSDDTVMDDVSNQGRMIADIDQDANVVLEEDKDVDADIVKDVQDAESAHDQGRQAESQAKIYKIHMGHGQKVLSMQEDESEPAEVQEVVEVVTTAKIISKVVTAASDPIIAASTNIAAAEAQVPAAPSRVTAAPSRRRKGVVIRDPEESTKSSTIIPAKTISKDKGTWILVEEPKPLKKQAQIAQDEAFSRELEGELNRNIDWDETKAQARKNMMIYLKNVAGFKMDYFKGMTYDDIHPVFEKHFDSNVALLQKTKEQIDEKESRALKRLNETQAEKAAKRKKLDDVMIKKKTRSSRVLISIAKLGVEE